MSYDIINWYKHLFSRVNRTTFTPIIAKEAQNSYVIDHEGVKYIDLTSSGATLNLGYNPPRISKIINEYSRKLTHFTFLYGFNIECLDLAKKLVEIAPQVGIDLKVYLGLSGSDANEASLILAKAFSNRRYILAFTEGFHGCSLGSNSASGIRLSRMVYSKVGGLNDVLFVPYPDCYRPKIDVGNKSCTKAYVEVFKAVIESLTYPEDIAALIFEPIQGDGGIVVPPKDYFSNIWGILKKYGILTIDDEVQTCLGRTGHWFAIEEFNVTPDIVTLGKPLGNGLPISAAVGPRDVMDALPNMAYTFSYVGNPMICRIAREVIDMIKEEKLVERARVLGSRVMQRLKSWVRKFNIVGDVRGLGLMIGVDIVKSKETKERGYNEAKKVVWRSYELGVIVNFVHGNVIRIQPPLNIDEDTLNRALDLLEEALEDVDEGRVSDDVIKYVEGW